MSVVPPGGGTRISAQNTRIVCGGELKRFLLKQLSASRKTFQCTGAVLHHPLCSKWQRPLGAETRTAGTLGKRGHSWFFQQHGRAPPEETAGPGHSISENLEILGNLSISRCAANGGARGQAEDRPWRPAGSCQSPSKTLQKSLDFIRIRDGFQLWPHASHGEDRDRKQHPRKPLKSLEI